MESKRYTARPRKEVEHSQLLHVGLFDVSMAHVTLPSKGVSWRR
jgi:hypothetical protein